MAPPKDVGSDTGVMPKNRPAPSVTIFLECLDCDDAQIVIDRADYNPADWGHQKK
jgi:hypothetical protein